MRRLALATLLIASNAAAQVGPGVDFRVMWHGRAIARGPGHVASVRDPVRVLLADGTTCDGTLGPDADTSIASHGDARVPSAEIRGCPSRDGQLAIVRPPSRAHWPRAIDASDPRAGEAITLGREAVTSAGHLHGEVTFDPPRVYALGDALYVLVTSAAAAAVVRVHDSRSEVVLARPAHGLWSHEELVESHFDWWGVVDLDGDGVIELLERQAGESAFMLRAVRVHAARPEGDVVWLASYRDDPADATIDRAPRALPVSR